MKILIIEDNPGDVRLIKEMLKEAKGDFTLSVAERLGEGLKLLLSQDVDVVLLDLGLPDSFGLDTLTKLQSQLSHRAIVVMTSTDNEALAIQAIQLGAQDYLVKGQVDSRQLHRALLYAIERKKTESLEQRNIQLEAINKELEAFSYSVSHDLRAPLRGIDGFSQALLEDYMDKLDAQGVDYLKRVRNATQRMGQLIDGLLQLSRLSRGELHRELVDLSALARKITENLKTTQPDRKVTFNIADGMVVQGAPELLQIVLENLLGNAWKFTGTHTAATIEFGATSREGKNAYFIRDDGAGFDMAFIDKLFGPFQRLHGRSEFEGNGIGLATVQRIINRHGGRVWAEGAVEKGATFYFTIPS